MTRFPFMMALIITPAMSMAQSDDADTCGAQGLQGLVGQSAEIAQMLVLEQPKRVIFPDTAVTRDYRLERINFDIDDAGQIVRVSCG